MTEINLEEFTEFAKVKDLWNYCNNDKKGLHEFLNNVVMNMNEDCINGYGNMLHCLSDIYVLISNKDFPFDKLINQKISIDLSVAKKNFVLGYIWMDSFVLKNEGCIPYHFISFIDSRISGLNISKYMIEKYEEQYEEEIFLFPFEILRGAEKYWRKYFMKRYEIKNKTELSQMMTEYGIKEHDVRWEALFSAFEM
jgi:hypothetical protein